MRNLVDHNPDVAKRQCFLPQINKAMQRMSWIWEAEFYLQATSLEEGQRSERTAGIWGSPEVTPGACPE